MTKITAKQAAVLARIKDGEIPAGTCTRWVWTYAFRNEYVTREVKALAAKGMIDIMYLGMSGGVAMSVTPEGMAA